VHELVIPDCVGAGGVRDDEVVVEAVVDVVEAVVDIVEVPEIPTQ
jgi:hypothetical protein